MYNQSKSSATQHGHLLAFLSADAATSTNSLFNRKPKSRTHFQIEADICALESCDDDNNIYFEQVNILKLNSKTDKQVN